MKDSLINITYKLLKNNKISFDREELSFQIQSHPSYPSLHAVTGVLDHFGIENVAAEVPVSSETLAQLPHSFLAQIRTERGEELVVVEKSNKTTNYLVFTAGTKKEKFSESNFLQMFTGVIVAVDKEENDKVKISTVKENVLLTLVAGLLITVVFYQEPALYSIFHIVLSLTGIAISLVILKQENGEETILGNAFCSGNTEKKDCDAVLTSKGAEIFIDHKLSDFSLLYFSGMLISSLFLLSNFSIIHYLSLLTFPITIYSIYYQYAVIKKWCSLCLTVVGVLWMQSILSFFQLEVFNQAPIFSSISVAFSFASVYLIWNFLKPVFIDLKNLKNDKIASVKFKRNYTLFDSLLQKTSIIDTTIVSVKEIIFGNPVSQLEIVVITNPFCGHCKPVHTIIEDMLRKYENNVKIVVRFNMDVDDLESDGLKVTSRLVELFDTKGAEECLKAMHAIYGGQEVEKWLQSWGTTENLEASVAVLKAENEWCATNVINFTPEILVNGRSYPKEYEREDILFFIEDLEENCCAQTVNTQLIN